MGGKESCLMFKTKTVESCIRENDLVSLEKILSRGKECGRDLRKIAFDVKKRWVQCSIELDRLEVLKYFVEHFDSISNAEPLYYAAYFERQEMIDYLLLRGENPVEGLEGAITSCNLSLCEHFFPLCDTEDRIMLPFLAVQTYDKNVIRWCVEKLDNRRVNSSLFEALYDGSQTTEEIVRMIDFLVDELGVPTEGGLSYIVSEGTLEAVEYFIRRGFASQKDIRDGTRDALVNCDTKKASYLFEQLEHGPKFARKIIRRVVNFCLAPRHRRFEAEEQDESFTEIDNVIFLLTYIRNQEDEASQVFFGRVLEKFKKLGMHAYTTEFEADI